MLRFRPLTAKFILIGLVIVAVLAVYFHADFRFMRQMQGEAARINMAGRQSVLPMRMLYSAKGVLAPPATSTEQQEYQKMFAVTVHELNYVFYVS